MVPSGNKPKESMNRWAKKSKEYVPMFIHKIFTALYVVIVLEG